MPRPFLLPASLILAALTALALLAGVFTIRTPAPLPLAADPAEAANRAVVQRFYGAVNNAIATGDSAELSAVVTPDYAERDTVGETSTDLIALERYLQALHEVTPRLQLVVDSLVADGDRVVALLHPTGADRGDVLGLGLDTPPPWGPVDVFRVADGRVAERASAGEPHALVKPVIQTPVELLPTTPPEALAGCVAAGRCNGSELQGPVEWAVTAVRVTLPPGDWHRAPTVIGLRVLTVETGSLAINVAEDLVRPAVIPAQDAPALPAGTSLVRSDGAGYAVRNVGGEPAVLLDLLAVIPPPSWAAGAAYSPARTGVAPQTLAGAPDAEIVTGSAALTVGRAELAPGAAIGWRGAAGPVLLFVEAGDLALTVDGRPAWVRRSGDGTVNQLRTATLATGDGAVAGAWTGAELRNPGTEPLEILIVTLIGDPNSPPPTATSPPAAPTPRPGDVR